jgi:hypothetical protein
MPDGEIVDFVFGSHPIVFGRSPSDRYTRELNLIESGEPSDVFAALNMLASTRR